MEVVDLPACFTDLDGEGSLHFLCSNDERLGEQSIDTIHPVTASRHPILELPPEILSEIFIDCLPFYSATPDPSRAPLLLGAICRDWRKTAHSTPWLWSSFILSVNLERAREDSAIIQLFECWLSRGGSCPLTMVISCYPGGIRSAEPLPASLVRALSHSSSRWHDVNLVLPLSDFYRLQANEGLPFLRRLAIKAIPDGPTHLDVTPPPPLDLFRNTPVLQDVYLGDGFTISNATLPLKQLKYFDARMTAAHHYIRVLQEALHLVEIGLDWHTTRSVDMPSAPVHSSIKSLSLRSFQLWENTFLDILDFVACPALETLIISGYSFTPIISPNPLSRFISRSSPPLQEFIINFPPSASDALTQMVQCLTAMPTLVRLEMKSLAAQTANDIFSRMCDTASLFLPNLQTLQLDVNPGLSGPDSWTYDTLVRMLVTRWNSQSSNKVAQLQVFGFSFSNFTDPHNPDAPTLRKPDSATLLQLSTLARQGMVLEIDLVKPDESSVSLI